MGLHGHSLTAISSQLESTANHHFLMTQRSNLSTQQIAQTQLVWPCTKPRDLVRKKSDLS